MKLHRRDPRRAVLIAAVALLTTAGAALATTAAYDRPNAIQVAQATDAAPPRDLEPRYQPVPPPPPKSWYNTDYFFAATRGVTDSTMAPVAKAPLFLLTVPLDLVLLPFAAIGGLFG